jgi:hypothetical protein
MSTRPQSAACARPPNAKTQRGRILRRLIDARGAWVPLPEIMACAAQYNARVLELRRVGFRIENRIEHIDGERHSWFRLKRGAAPGVSGERALSDHEKCSRNLEAEAMPLFVGGDR